MSAPYLFIKYRGCRRGGPRPNLYSMNMYHVTHEFVLRAVLDPCVSQGSWVCSTCCCCGRASSCFIIQASRPSSSPVNWCGPTSSSTASLAPFSQSSSGSGQSQVPSYIMIYFIFCFHICLNNVHCVSLALMLLSVHRGCFLTSSLIGTLSLSLTIPLSILADIYMQKVRFRNDVFGICETPGWGWKWKADNNDNLDMLTN